MVQSGSSPSNRKGTTPKNGVLQVRAGVDRLSVTFPVWAYEGRPEAWVTRSISGSPSSERRLLNGFVQCGAVRVFVGVSEAYVDGAMIRRTGKFECNPSRVLDPDGYSLASLSEASECFSDVLGAVEQLVVPSCDVSEFRVTRLDVARDFVGVDHPSVLIRSLGSLHRPWSRRNLTHADPSRNGAQTLMVGSGAGVVRLYDKAEETRGKAPPGTVRWEAECRKAWAENYGGVKHLGDLSDDSVDALASDRWEWSQMGAEVAGDLSRLVERVSVSDLSAAQKRGFLGFLVQQAAGLDCSDISQTTLAKYRRLQRELGIVAPAQLSATVRLLRRLDWDSGVEVQRVA